MIYAASWVNNAIEVPLGANLIPKGTALECSVIIPMYSACDLLRKKRILVRFSFPKQRPHTRLHRCGSTAAYNFRRPAGGLPRLARSASLVLQTTPKPRVPAGNQRAADLQSPASRKFCLASGGCNFGKTRPWLGLVDLRRIPNGIFFLEVHPGSEMACQNDQNKAK